MTRVSNSPASHSILWGMIIGLFSCCLMQVLVESQEAGINATLTIIVIIVTVPMLVITELGLDAVTVKLAVLLVFATFKMLNPSI